MLKFISLVYKDYLLLWRDKIGLCILFVMPMFFVFTITLLQSDRTPDNKSLPIIIANFDQGDIMQKMKNGLSDKIYSIQEIIKPDISQLKIIQDKTAKGIYKLLIIIPAGTSKQLTAHTQQSITNTNHIVLSSSKIVLIFDPAIEPNLKDAIVLRIQSLAQTYTLQVMKNIVGEVLGTIPSVKNEPPLPLQITYAGNNAAPNVVQQNIPAWALFGMFFIALPLASIMIKEREQSVSTRIRIAPVSNLSLVISRLVAFISVNFLQLWLMLCIGLFVIPLFHLPALNISHHIGAIVIIGLFSSFAATSFGLLIGAFTRTIEQASSVVPILIILAAAIGGIMIPTYLMPDSMQVFSAFSPLHWGHQAFIDVLLHDFTVTQILWPLGKLGLFSVMACTIAWWRYSYKIF